MAAADYTSDGVISADPAYRSSVLEKVLEYRFLADLLAHLLTRSIDFDVLRGDVDLQGHDLVIEANGIVRHIQLKATVAGGKRSKVNVNTKLSSKPSGCVVWMRYHPETLEIGPFGWLGGLPGEPLPDLGTKLVRHSKGNAQGFKAERAGHRIVGRSRFTMVPDISGLAHLLFGTGKVDISAILNLQLRASAGAHIEVVLRSLCPEQLDWSNSVGIAHLIDGYELIQRAGLGTPSVFADQQLSRARETGFWSGDLPELWATLFLEHRRWRMSAPMEPGPDARNLLDRLCEQLQTALQRAGYLAS
ncbi:hypothetical protein GVO57_14245 (plasmid) [Sphingomonas changnyeongensis]|uniref:DUF4365 domain-containing protein n=1 Tax=Sphingomonas changnyeongensis TaxID=2698679 RepID=A0A7Z2NYA6_9SPHN|nr:hypothetical protein [Sphingomonas changnyeongensis]QHL92043.1 hypothetical protein GVO57_14245 [Sphingomonas changnyeongensis]